MTGSFNARKFVNEQNAQREKDQILNDVTLLNRDLSKNESSQKGRSKAVLLCLTLCVLVGGILYIKLV